MRKALLTTVSLLTCTILWITAVSAVHTGTIEGRITDKESGQPVIGVTVMVVGTNLGAMTDLEGRFAILRVPVGVYTMKISSVEYSTVEITDVEVKTDEPFEVNEALTKCTSELDQVITVMGTAPIIDKFVTTSQVSISQEEIKSLPVASVDQLLQQVCAVQTSTECEVFVRGTPAGEVSYCVDGVPLGDPIGGGSIGASMSLVTGSRPDQPWPPAHGGSANVNDEPFSAMFFEGNDVNPFVDTEDDRLSTYAVDVDDASYIMARSYLERGEIPPKDAIRTEEFVNHFDYNYAAPRNDAFQVSMEAAPSKFGQNNVWMLHVGIKGLEIAPENRKAANLVFVVDISGSMACENRLGLVRKSLHLLLDELTPRDRVGIVAYGNQGEIRLYPTSVENRDKIAMAIDRLQSAGSTNAEAGLRLGYEMADRMFENSKINRVILCTDGVANVGVTGADGLLERIKKYARKGITLASIGYGMGNHNDKLLEKLGNKGDGYHAYVDDIEEARRVFVDNLTGSLQVIARDVKVQFEFNPEVVRSYRLLGYENREVADNKFRDDDEDGGEIGGGHASTALYELKLHTTKPNKQIGELFVRYKDPETKKVAEVSYPFTTNALTPTFEQTGNDFKLAAAAAEYAEILRGSYWAKGSDMKDVLSVVTGLYIDTSDPDILELMGLITKADRFSEQLAER